MLKPFPSFVASLHVTLRIEPLGRAIDETAAFEKLSEGLEAGALDAVRSVSWKGYCITIDKVPPAPPPAGEKADIDPAVVSTAPLDLTNRTEVARTAAYLELVRQASHASNFRLPRYGAEVEGYTYSSRVTVGGVLDVSALADAVRLALEA